MKIELWEDVVCSWCGIANERVNQALQQFGHADEVELVHRSFRLLSDMPDGQSMNTVDLLSSQRGVPAAQAQQMGQQLLGLAKKVGLERYHVVDNQVGNTTLAHEFLAWASAQGRQNEAWDLLFREYFGNRAPLWTVDYLVPFAEHLGLEAEAARQALDSREYRDQVEADHDEVLALGASGVPFLVIDRKYGISGAQRVELIVEALQKAWSERQAVAA